MNFRRPDSFPCFDRHRNVLPGDNIYSEKNLEFDFMFTSNRDIVASYDLFKSVVWVFSGLTNRSRNY